MKPTFRIALVALIATCMLLVAAPQPAAAHPLGNFTINQYSKLTVGTSRVDVFYVLDMAEIPTFQELGTINPDHSTNLTPAQREAYTATKSAELLKGLSLSVNGVQAPLSLGKAALSFPPGNSGLPTLRLELNLSATVGGIEKGTLEYRDNNYAERIGWKEIIARPAKGTSPAMRNEAADSESANVLRPNRCIPSLLVPTQVVPAKALRSGWRRGLPACTIDQIWITLLSNLGPAPGAGGAEARGGSP